MRKSTVLACTSVLLLALSTVAPAAEPPSKEEALVRELLEVTGGAEMAQQIVRQMMEASIPAESEEFRKLREAMLAELDVAAFLETIVPIYEKHFTAEEMEAAIAFYRTPAGQSMLRKMPLVMGEAMQHTQEWAAKLTERALARVKAEREDAAPRP